ncbi:MAG: hypothetical protein HY394_02800 [Candidatus Diapherotrites archaeon]|nr:hypothetical protein [Candidatus Diapherotrites archaeon]
MEKFAIALLFLSSAFLAGGAIYVSHPFPLVADSWDHVAIINGMVAGKSLAAQEPYYVHSEEQALFENPEFGFHALMALLVIFTGLDAFALSLIFPTIVTFIAMLSTFILVRHFLRSPAAGIFSALAVLAMKPTAFLLGFRYFAPMGLGLAMVPLLIYLFFRSAESKKFLLAFFTVLAGGTAIYPVYSLLLAPLFAFYFLIDIRAFLRHKIFFVLALAVVPALFYAYTDFLSNGTGQADEMVKSFFFEPYSVSEKNLNIFSGVSPLIMIFSVVGLAGLAFMRKPADEIVPLVVEAFFLSALFVLFTTNGYSFLAPAARLFSLFSLFASLFAGFGFYFIMERFFSGKHSGTFFAVAALLLLAVPASGLVSEQGEARDSGARAFDSGAQKHAIEWLKANGSGGAVLAFPESGRAINVLTGLKVSPVPAARMGTPDKEMLTETTDAIDSGDCKKIFSSMEKYAVSQIFRDGHQGKEFRWKLSCHGMDKAYSLKGIANRIEIYVK